MIAFDSSKREKGKVFRKMQANKRHINKNTRTLMRNIRKEQTDKGQRLADLTTALKYKDAIDYFNKNTRHTRKPTNHLVIRS